MFAIYGFNQIVLADVARGEVIGTLVIGHGTGAAVTFADNDRTLIAVNAAGRVTRVPIDPDVWAARACAVASSPQSLQRFAVDAPAGTTPARCALDQTSSRHRSGGP
jgi:hypothetical protein